MKSPEGYKEEIKSLYDAGKSVDEISKIFKKSKRTIQTHLKNMDVVRNTRKGEIKCDQEYIDKLKQLYIDGYNTREIGDFFGRSEKTIGYHLRKHNVSMRSSKKINEDEFIKLWNAGKTDEEIASYFNCEITSVRSYRTKGDNAGKYNVIRYFSQEEHELSNLQKQMILGSLLGDMSISNPLKKRAGNSRLAIVHCKKQEALFMKKVEILDNFMGNYKYCTPSADKRTGKVYDGYRGNSKAHKIFTDLYHIMYIDNIKTVTSEYLKMINHPIALAYLFMDDGCERGTIATMSFSKEENELISDWLRTNWKINSTVQLWNKTKYQLYLTQDTRLNFERLIFPYMIESMYYKLRYCQLLQSENNGQ